MSEARKREYAEWLAAQEEAADYAERVFWPALEANSPWESKLRAYQSLGVKLP